MEGFAVPWWGWLVLVGLVAVWIVLIGILMELVRWLAEKIIGELPGGPSGAQRRRRPK